MRFKKVLTPENCEKLEELYQTEMNEEEKSLQNACVQFIKNHFHCSLGTGYAIFHKWNEIYCHSLYDTAEFHYNMNIAPHGANTPEWRAKIGNANRGKKRTPEQRKHISEALTGCHKRPMTEEHKAKIALAMKKRHELGIYKRDKGV